MRMPLEEVVSRTQTVARGFTRSIEVTRVVAADGEADHVELLVTIAGCHETPCTVANDPHPFRDHQWRTRVLHRRCVSPGQVRRRDSRGSQQPVPRVVRVSRHGNATISGTQSGWRSRDRIESGRGRDTVCFVTDRATIGYPHNVAAAPLISSRNARHSRDRSVMPVIATDGERNHGDIHPSVLGRICPGECGKRDFGPSADIGSAAGSNVPQLGRRRQHPGLCSRPARATDGEPDHC
jgi:hypothetical protein